MTVKSILIEFSTDDKNDEAVVLELEDIDVRPKDGVLTVRIRAAGTMQLCCQLAQELGLSFGKVGKS